MNQKDKGKEGTDYYMEAYFQGRWVFVPIPYVPEDIFDKGTDGIGSKEIVASADLRVFDDARDAIVSTITESIDPDTLSDRKLRRLCRSNDIPLGWVSNRFSRKNIRVSEKDSVENDRNRKYSSLSPSEFRRFVVELRSMSSREALIAELIWFLNKHLDPYVPLEALLRLKVDAVAPESHLSTWIRLSYYCNRRSFFSIFVLSKYLWKRLRKQIKSDSYLVFSNKKGAPLLVGDLDRTFAIAGKRAGIKGKVTSLSLRPNKREKREIVLNRLNLDSEVNLKEVSQSDWLIIQKQVPELWLRRGRKAICVPRDILNCILLHLREGVSVRRASDKMSLSENAVESQFRRWRSNRMLHKILSTR